MTLPDDLSRLLSGELSPEEEARLLERIANEPDVADAWARLQLIESDLHGLPDFRPPPHLDRAVIARVNRPLFELPRWPVVVAAAVLFGLLLPRPDPDITILDGSEIVDGDVDVLAAGVEIGVDGRARISVEPDVGPTRGMGSDGVQRHGAEDRDMKIVAVAGAGALVGSLVTVTMFEGTAHMKGPDGRQVDVAEGQTEAMHAPRPSEPGSLHPLPVASATPKSPAATEAELRARVDELEKELQEVRFEQALAKGQLAQHEGTAKEFPKDLADAYRPDAFKASIEGIVGGIPGADLVTVDCAEYPCIAVIGKNGPAESWGTDLKADLESSFPSSEDEKSGMSIWMSNMKDDDREMSVAAVAVYPPKGQTGADTSDGTGPEARSNFRAETLMRDAAAEQLE
jgi:hypothetical protein